MARGIPGLKSLTDLSKQEQEEFRQQALREGWITPQSSFSAIYDAYDDMQFRQKFGEDVFNSMPDRESRYKFLEKKLVDLGLEERYRSRVTSTGRDSKGNYYEVSEPASMGEASKEEWNTIMNLSSAGKRELLNSDWRPQKEADKTYETINDYYTKGISVLNPGIGSLIAPLHSKLISHYTNERNRGTLNEIKERDAVRKSLEVLPLQEANYAQLDAIDDESLIEKEFIRQINERHIGPYQAFYNDGKKVYKAMKDFSIVDMKNFLAKAQALDQVFDQEQVSYILNKDAAEYVRNNQGNMWNALGRWGNDVGVGLMSYLADHVNSARKHIELAEGKTANVLVDSKGEILPESTVFVPVTEGSESLKLRPDVKETFDFNTGKTNYILPSGEVLTTQEISVAALDDMGKNPDGTDKNWFTNNVAWTKAEATGYIFDAAERDRLYETGYSPERTAYNPGEGPGIIYSTTKMMSFGLANVITGRLIGGGLSALGSGLKNLATTSRFLKAEAALARAAGKGAVSAELATKYVAEAGAKYPIRMLGTALEHGAPASMAVLGATGIGHAYGRNVFNENLHDNLLKLSQKTSDTAEKRFSDRYELDEDFKASVDAEVQQRFEELMAAQGLSPEALKTENGAVSDSDLRKSIVAQRLLNQAMQEVGNAHIKSEYEALQQSPDYLNARTAAIETASKGATIAEVTDAIKYSLVNLFGYRSYLYKNPSQRINSYLGEASSKVTEDAAGVLQKAATPSRSALLRKAATSQFIGGGWTNYTDEMQAAGGKAVNTSAFDKYMQGVYDPEATNVTYSFLETLSDYIGGGLSVAANDSSLEAFLVGGLGALIPLGFDPVGIVKVAANWKSMSASEKFNTALSWGIFNDYQARKDAYKQINEQVERLNKIAESSNGFSGVIDALKLNLTDINVDAGTNDENITSTLKALNLIKILKEEIPDNSVPRELAEKSSKYKEALDLVDQLTYEEFDENTAKRHLDAYFEYNHGVPRTPENEEKALATIVENAKALKEAENTFDEVVEVVNEYSANNKESVPSNVSEELIRVSLLEKALNKSIDELKEKVGVSDEEMNTQEGTKGQGSKETLNSRITSILKSISSAEKELSEIDKELEKVDKDIESTLEEATTAQNLAESEGFAETVIKHQTKRGNLVAAQNSQRLLIDALKQKRGLLEKALEEANSTEEEAVLTAEQIKALPVQERARMLNKAYEKEYSEAQQAIITQVRNELLAKDPNAVNNLIDLARYLNYRRGIEESKSWIYENPINAAFALEARQGARVQEIQDFFFDELAKDLSQTLESVKANPAIDPDKLDITKGILKFFSKVKSNYIQGILSAIERDSSLPIASYKENLEQALEYKKFMEQIELHLNKVKDNTTREYLEASLNNLFANVTTKEGAIGVIKRAVESGQINETYKAELETILKELNALEDTKQATATTEEITAETPVQASTPQPVTQEPSVAATNTTTPVAAEQPSQPSNTSSEAPARNPSTENSTTESMNSERGESTEQKPAGAQEETAPKNTTNTSEAAKPAEPTVSKEQPVTDDSTTETRVYTEAPISDTDSEKELLDGATIVAEDSSDVESMRMEGEARLTGNYVPEISWKELRQQQREVIKNTTKNDFYSKFINWLKSSNIQLQHIIDYELHNILQANPNIKMVRVNPNNQGISFLGDHILLAVEYTPEVANVHNEEYGGVITSGNTNYLIVGLLYADKNKMLKNIREIRSTHRNGQITFFKEHPQENYYVYSDVSLEMKNIHPGFLIRQTSRDERTLPRSIVELVEGPERENRNPLGLALEDLAWIIQYYTKPKIINGAGKQIVPPRDAISNAGSVFVMIPTANGTYIPAQIEAVSFNRLKNNSVLKDTIINYVKLLKSPNYTDRLNAINALVKLLVLQEGNKQILIGSPTRASLKIIDGTRVIAEFRDLNSISDNQVLEALIRLDPRINITKDVLSSVTEIRKYADAGALNTNIARLHTIGADYELYPVNSDGTAIKPEVLSSYEPRVEVSSDLAVQERKQRDAVIVNGEIYRRNKYSGLWFDQFDQVVTDQNLLAALNYNSYIQVNQIPAAKTEGNLEYFILDNNLEDPTVIVRDVSEKLATKVTDTNKAKEIIQEFNKAIEKKSRENAAKTLNSVEDTSTTEQSETPTLVPKTVGEPLMPQATNTAAPESVDTVSEGRNLASGITTEMAEPPSTTPPVAPQAPSQQASSYDINSAKGLSPQADTSSATRTYTFEDIMNDEESADRVYGLVEEKLGEAPDRISELKELLRSKGIEVNRISSIDALLRSIECL